MRIPGALRRYLDSAAEEAARLGVPLYVVGGCVRDWMLGVPSQHDVDLVTEGEAAPAAREFAKRWQGTVETFDRFGTVRVTLPRLRVDFARARAETYASPAALPIVRPASLRDDLVRRDFTVNAMALPLSGTGDAAVVDPHGGARDLGSRRLRVLHSASFKDDPTRLFRAARYAGRFGLRLEADTERLLREAVSGGAPALLSRERVRQELFRLLEEKDPAPAFRLARAWGLDKSFQESFRWPAAAKAGRGAFERLGVVALSMPEGRGEALLAGLPIERAAAQALGLALKLARAKASPRGPLPPLAERALRLRFPRLPRAALKPLLIRGEDLARLGLQPGKDFSARLDRAARAQWRGEFSSRSQAVRWLARHQ